MIRWALSIYNRSPAAYRHIAKSLNMPDLGTLRNHSAAIRGYEVNAPLVGQGRPICESYGEYCRAA